MIEHRKLVTAGTIIFVLIVSAIRWRSNYTNRRLPDFASGIVDNANLATRDFDKGLVNILIVQRINAFALSYIRVLHNASQDDHKRLLIFCSDELSLQDYGRTAGTHIFMVDDVRRMGDLFHLPKSKDNWILQYNNGVLALRARFNSSIVRKLGFNQAAATQGRRGNDVSSDIADILGAYEDGVYYCAQRLVASCACYEAFEFLKNELAERGNRLRLLLIGDFNDIDIENFNKEEAGRAIIIRPNADINNLGEKWEREAKGLDLTVIVFKNMTISRVFPLIDARDYQSWHRFERNEFQDVIDAFKAK
jgi:hypothetical protein